MACSFSNSCTKNYWNRTTIVEIIVDGWVVSFFETHRHSVSLVVYYLRYHVDKGYQEDLRDFAYIPNVHV